VLKLLDDINSQLVENTSKLLTQLDRDPLSPTFGCFDRNFWHYKIRDFSSIVLQQNCLSIALLYKYNFPNNIYYKKSFLLKYVKGSIEFWSNQQSNNGGFDEYWPKENGYPPLVFSLNSIIKTILLLKIDTNKHIKKSLEKAALLLISQKENKASNQEIAGVSTIYKYYILTKNKLYLQKFKNRLKNILDKQTKEGWFPEYGGADIGYSSVSLHYLTEIYQDTKSHQVKESIIKLIDFLSNFIHPDGTMGGEYGSRNTEYFLLGGLAAASIYSKTSQLMIQNINWSLQKFDDRYLFHYIFHSYIQGYIHLYENKTKFNVKRLKSENKPFKHYKQSGLFIYQKNKTRIYINTKKGGVYKIFINNKLYSKNGGIRVKTNKVNQFLVSNHLQNTKCIFNKNNLTIQGFLYKKTFVKSSPLKHIALRLVALLPFKREIITTLKKIIIFQDKPSKYLYKRIFMFNKNEIVVKDRITSPFKNINTTREGSMRFVPSSRFFDISEASVVDSFIYTTNTNYLDRKYILSQ